MTCFQRCRSSGCQWLQVTFTARGNLVVVPKTLVQQWRREIKKVSKVGTRVLDFTVKATRGQGVQRPRRHAPVRPLLPISCSLQRCYAR